MQAANPARMHQGAQICFDLWRRVGIGCPGFGRLVEPHVIEAALRTSRRELRGTKTNEALIGNIRIWNAAMESRSQRPIASGPTRDMDF